jgi:hypothetical protein
MHSAGLQKPRRADDRTDRPASLKHAAKGRLMPAATRPSVSRRVLGMAVVAFALLAIAPLASAVDAAPREVVYDQATL